MTRREIRHAPTIQRDWSLADREDTAVKVGALGDVVVRPGDPLDEGRIVDNAMLLLAGDHGKMRTLKSTRLDGSPGALASGPSEFSHDESVSGLSFKDTVAIGASARVRFFNCTFHKVVTMTSGGEARFFGCAFVDIAAINNAGAPLNAQALGCLRTSGVAHTNVTLVGGEMT